MDTKTVTTTLITQLRALQQLTNTEVQIAKVRVTQARTDAVRRELEQNGANAERRAGRIGRELATLGGVPDVVTPAIGRVLALVKATVEQAQPLDEALLGDLTLEHQLLDRARYVRTLAQRAERRSTENLADALVTAHEATVEWLTTVLAEEALGGVAALEPTPLQRVAGGVTRVVGLPTRFAVERFNEAVAAVQRTGTQAREGAGDIADAVHATRRDLGTLRGSELPIRGYDELNGQDAIAAARTLTAADDITAVVTYEEHHKNRAGVVSAAQAHLASVAKDAAGV
jgi:hypothetical protein